MTEAIGGASQTSFVALEAAFAKPGTAKATAKARLMQGVGQMTAALTDETKAGDQTAGQSFVQKSGKTSWSANDEVDNGDDVENTFEATIDSMDRSSLSLPAADATQAATWSAQFVLGQMSVARILSSEGDRTSGANVAGKDLIAAAPMGLLNQKSDADELATARIATAAAPLLIHEGDSDSLTKGKIATAPADSLNQENAAAIIAVEHEMHSGEAPQDASASQPTDTPLASSVVVQSRETHWAFGPNLVTASPGGVGLLQGASVSTNALTSGSQVAKVDSRVATDISDASKPMPAQSSSLGVVSDTTQGQRFSDRSGEGASRRDQTSSGANDRATLEISTAKSTDLETVDAAVTVAAIPTATQQVEKGVLDALTSDPSKVQQANTPLTLQDRPTVSGQVMRTIELTLSPADLGSVHLRLSLRSNTLTIEAETSKASTAKLLNDDRGILKQNLSDAGYDLSTLKITDAGTNNSTGSNSSLAGGTQFQDNGQTRAGFAQRQDGDLQRRDGSTPDESQQRSNGGSSQSSPSSDTTSTRQSNAIYI